MTGSYGRVAGALSVSLVCGSAQLAWAQTSADSAQPSTSPEPETVTVTAHRLEEQLPGILESQGIRVDVITADQIADGAYLDIATSLQMLAPGLYVSPKNGPFDYVNVSLLGSRTEDVLWLLDGVRMNNRLYGGTTPLDTLPSTIVDRIEVLEGGQGLFYGTEAAAGAVDILTKDFSKTPDGAVTIGGDTNLSGHFDGYYRDSVGSNQFVVYGDFDASRGFQPFPSNEIQPSDTDRDRAYHLFTAGVKYAYDFTDDLRYSGMFQHTSGKLNFSVPFEVADAYNSRDENVLTSKLDFTPSNAFEFFVKGYYHWWDSHYTELDNVVGSPGEYSVAENNGFWGFSDRGVNLMGKFTLSSELDGILGYDFQNYEGHDAVLVIQQKTESVNAVFGQIATSPDWLPHTNFAAGVRFNDPTVGPNATIWTVSGQHDWQQGLFMRGQAGTAFRLPTAEELFANDPNDELGDPNLKPERSTNINLSFGDVLGAPDSKLRWELIGFWRDVTNLIEFTGFDAATDQSVFGNVAGTVEVRGGEMEVAYERPQYSFDVNYTYSHSVQPGGIQVSDIPAQEAKVTLDYHPTDQPFGVTVSAIYVGAEQASGLGANYDQSAEYGKYPLLDLAGRYYCDAKRRHILTLSLENALDRRYASSLGTAIRDSDGSYYNYENLGVPLTFSARYTYKL